MTLLSSLTLSDGEGNVSVDLSCDRGVYTLKVKSELYEIDRTTNYDNCQAAEDAFNYETGYYRRIGFKATQHAKGNPYPKGRWTPQQ